MSWYVEFFNREAGEAKNWGKVPEFLPLTGDDGRMQHFASIQAAYCAGLEKCKAEKVGQFRVFFVGGYELHRRTYAKVDGRWTLRSVHNFRDPEKDVQNHERIRKHQSPGMSTVQKAMMYRNH